MTAFSFLGLDNFKPITFQAREIRWVMLLAKCFVAAFIILDAYGNAFALNEANVERARSVAEVCEQTQSPRWGIGSTLVHIIKAVNRIRPSKFYWDHSPSPYTCCPSCKNNGLADFFQGFQEIAPVGCPSIDFGDLVRRNRQERGQCDYCEALAEVWNLTESMSTLVESRVNQMRSYKKPVLLLNVRGGDKVASATTEMPLGYNYTQNIEKQIENLSRNSSYEKNGTCIITGDDWSLSQIVTAKVVPLLGCTVLNRIPKDYKHHQSSFNRFPLEQRCEMTKEVILDVESLVHADKAFVLGVSNLSRLAYAIQKCRYNRTSITDWGDMDLDKLSCYFR